MSAENEHLPEAQIEVMPDRGRHIFVNSTLHGIPFQHHGIDMGDDTVIHLAPEKGARMAIDDKEQNFSVRRDTMKDFLQGKELQVIEHEEALPPEICALAAEEALGQSGYCLLDGNCEHFAMLCATGRWESQQIEFSEAVVAALASAATKGIWSLGTKLGAKALLRSATKVHPAAMLADGVELATLMASCRYGVGAAQSKQLARVSGRVAAAGIGGVLGGPAGAALGLAAHTSSGVVADRICKEIKRLIKASARTEKLQNTSFVEALDGNN